jgi:hypothetical protein
MLINLTRVFIVEYILFILKNRLRELLPLGWRGEAYSSFLPVMFCSPKERAKG